MNASRSQFVTSNRSRGTDRRLHHVSCRGDLRSPSGHPRTPRTGTDQLVLSNSPNRNAPTRGAEPTGATAGRPYTGLLRRHFGTSNAHGGESELARKLAALERKYDGQFKMVFEAIRDLMTPAPKEKPRIGFRKGES